MTVTAMTVTMTVTACGNDYAVVQCRNAPDLVAFALSNWPVVLWGCLCGLSVLARDGARETDCVCCFRHHIFYSLYASSCHGYVVKPFKDRAVSIPSFYVGF